MTEGDDDFVEGRVSLAALPSDPNVFGTGESKHNKSYKSTLPQNIITAFVERLHPSIMKGVMAVGKRLPVFIVK